MKSKWIKRDGREQQNPNRDVEKDVFQNKGQRVVRILMGLIVWNVKHLCVSKQTILP